MRGILVGALRGRQHRVHGRKHSRAIVLDRIERAGGGETLQHPLVDRARIDAAGEIGEIGEGRSPRAARMLSTACRPTPRNAANA